MLRCFMKSKIHRATVTGVDLNYEGSITIDETLLKEADILPGEKVQVLNINNGERFITYTFSAPADSGTVLLNGPAARMALPGDIVVIITYCCLDEKELKNFKPKVVFVDEKNRPKKMK